MIILTQSTTKPKFKEDKKKVAIKSFLYRTPKVEKPIEKISEEQPIKDDVKPKESEQKNQEVPKDKLPKEIKSVNVIAKPAPTLKNENSLSKKLEPSLLPAPVEQSTPQPQQPPQSPRKKLDSFTQLQRLRSKLNQSARTPTDNPYQRYKSPSVFNSNPKAVPHSVPLKDEEKEREKSTKNMGGGIAITKGENGSCEIKQDMSVYGLNEGSSIQKFSCGETKFDKSFREHMKKVKTKLGK
ncbi:hypothetical protein [Cognaticolwellia mytili]|uniref:hypothetical protein n=1 Tax=Cognaticolwellia mytili TaxID=1888913 RepID=UPI0011802066|nr:hypothetical protein [Cognaticolwellia mytili]